MAYIDKDGVWRYTTCYVCGKDFMDGEDITHTVGQDGLYGIGMHPACYTSWVARQWLPKQPR